MEVGICVVYEGGGGSGDGEQGDGGGGGKDGIVCADEWPAVLRKEDVRATEKDKVVCAEGFRVGDVIRGVVVRASIMSRKDWLSLAPFFSLPKACVGEKGNG